MRVRITFSKTGALRYIGHLDLNYDLGTRRAPRGTSAGIHTRIPSPAENDFRFRPSAWILYRAAK